jgi:site-specific recombinase XerD
LFFYNTGARVQEVADVRIEHLELGASPRVRLHGKGDKWRICPLWPQTVDAITRLLHEAPGAPAPTRALFTSRGAHALTRFGLYKIVRRHTDPLRIQRAAPHHRPVGPHVFRHTAAVHLLEAGVDVNVIRGWLGHVSLETTNRYAEINTRVKEAAVRLCEPSVGETDPPRRTAVWRDDHALLEWLASL